MTDRLALPRRYRDQLEALLREHVPGVEVWAYGSRVNGESHDGSDLDLALRGPALEPLDGGFNDLLEAIEKSTIPILVQAHDWARLPESFHREIERDYVVVQEGAKQTAANSWREVALGDVAEIVMGQSPPGDKVSGDNGLALLNGPTEFGASHPTPVQFTIDARKYAQPGDILFCVRGSTTGRMNWADQEYAIGRGVAAIRHKNDSALQPFVRGVIELGLSELLAQATGSTFPNVSAQQLAEIPYPSLDEDEQRAIAHVLGTLDDKIELNRRMNRTLEEMARAIFQDWFVDFGPTRAKIEDRESYLPSELWDMFPDELVDSELGEIPEGWEVEPLGEIIELAYGKALKAGDRKGGTVPVYGSNGQVGWHDVKLVSGPGIIVGRKGNPGTVTWSHEDFFPIDTAFYVVPESPDPALHFLHYALIDQDLPSMAADSAVPGLNRNLAYMNDQLVPKRSLMEIYDSYVEELFIRMHLLEKESHDLTLLRDTLLPRLLSGEIKIEEG